MRKRILGLLRLPRPIIFILIALVLAGVGIFIFKRTRTEPVQPVTVVEEVGSVVSASGVLKGKDTVDLKFASGGRLSYVGVNEGDRVRRGQVIARIDSQELSVSLQQAQNTLRDKQATLDKVYDDVKDHKSDESFAQKQARTTAEVAKDNAYDQIRAIESAMRNNYLYSPISGIVTQSFFKTGQFISGADIIARVVDDKKIYFDAEVDEADIGRVKVGDTAEVILNSLPDKVLKGVVEKIIPQVKTAASGATVVMARIALDNPETLFISGVNGQAEIKID